MRTHTRTFMYIYIYMFLCVCVCALIFYYFSPLKTPSIATKTKTVIMVDRRASFYLEIGASLLCDAEYLPTNRAVHVDFVDSTPGIKLEIDADDSALLARPLLYTSSRRCRTMQTNPKATFYVRVNRSPMNCPPPWLST